MSAREVIVAVVVTAALGVPTGMWVQKATAMPRVGNTPPAPPPGPPPVHCVRERKVHIYGTYRGITGAAGSPLERDLPVDLHAVECLEWSVPEASPPSSEEKAK